MAISPASRFVFVETHPHLAPKQVQASTEVVLRTAWAGPKMPTGTSLRATTSIDGPGPIDFDPRDRVFISDAPSAKVATALEPLRILAESHDFGALEVRHGSKDQPTTYVWASNEDALAGATPSTTPPPAVRDAVLAARAAVRAVTGGMLGKHDPTFARAR